jgi:hypothetical protein
LSFTPAASFVVLIVWHKGNAIVDRLARDCGAFIHSKRRIPLIIVTLRYAYCGEAPAKRCFFRGLFFFGVGG